MPISKLKAYPRATLGLAAMLAVGIGFVIASRQLDKADVLHQIQHLSDWVAINPILAMVGFFLFSVVGKVGPVPGGLVVMLSGGFLFGGVAGALLAATGGGLCAMLITLIGRRFFHRWLMDRHGARIEALRRALGRDVFWVVLALRLTPITPAWFGNLVPIALPISALNVWLATTLGVLPISLTVGFLGAELQSLTEVTEITGAQVFTPELLLPLFGLAAISLAPIFIRRKLDQVRADR
jgi:uncharacterized membrane protein YdjX (TVP38/TMEM64 family)